MFILERPILVLWGLTLCWLCCGRATLIEQNADGEQIKRSDLVVIGNNIRHLDLLDFDPQINIDSDILDMLLRRGDDGVEINSQFLSDDVLVQGNNNTVVRGAVVKPQISIRLDVIEPLKGTADLVRNVVKNPRKVLAFLRRGPNGKCVIAVERIEQTQVADRAMIGRNNRIITLFVIKPKVNWDFNLMQRVVRQAQCNLETA